MCGRFFVAEENENDLLARMIDEASRRQQAITGESSIARGEVFPSATVAALTMGKDGNIGVFPMGWGFHRPDNKGLIINARSETALEKPLFRQSMLTRRCLVPCSWYYEWETRDAQQSLLEDMPSLRIDAGTLAGKGKSKSTVKIKYAIRAKAPGVIFLAGIYRYEENQKLPVLSILTREPSPEIEFIHDRMPVIFSDREHGAWLDRNADPMNVLKLCEKEMAYRAA